MAPIALGGGAAIAPPATHVGVRPAARARPAPASEPGPAPAADSRRPVPGDGGGAAGPSRRALLAGAAAGLGAGAPRRAAAVQGITAGRIPGVTGPGADGLLTYTRPEGKSGGHGVGWSEIPRYSFKLPPGWEEVPVSIADLGGTEIDLRYARPDSGSLQVVVAPVNRFKEVGFNADVRIRELAPPDRMIAGFGPELYGRPLEEGDVLAQRAVEKGGLEYYEWALKPHRLVAATAVGNRVFILAIDANGRQWRNAQADLETIQRSFAVPLPK